MQLIAMILGHAIAEDGALVSSSQEAMKLTVLTADTPLKITLEDRMIY